jgi:hypothetical protein
VDCSVLWDWPTRRTSPLNVFGGMELFVEKGVVYGDGATEWVGLGYFRLNELDQQSAPRGPIAI